MVLLNYNNCGCECGELPYTMTVEFSDLPTRAQGSNCNLSFSSNFGSGASGVIISPGGCDDQDSQCITEVIPCSGNVYSPSDRGPISEILLTNSGSCYAKIGRVPPLLKARCIGDDSSIFNIKLIEEIECLTGFQYWRISGIDVANSGYYPPPYTQGNAAGIIINIICSSGDTKDIISNPNQIVVDALLETSSNKEEPDLLVNVAGGSGASISPQIAITAWGVGSIDISNPGSGYLDGSPLYLKLPDPNDTSWLSTTATINTSIVPPEFNFPTPFSPSLSAQNNYDDGKKYWSVSNIAITGVVGGYPMGTPVNPVSVSGVIDTPLCASVSAVDINGNPTAIKIDYGGRYWRDSGQIESITIKEPGLYLEEPELSTQPTYKGEGAEFHINTIPVRWGVVSCSVEDGGSGYKDLTEISISDINHSIPNIPNQSGEALISDVKASGVILTILEEPEISLTAMGGREASLEPVFTQTICSDNRPCWTISSISIVNPGKNYTIGDQIMLKVLSGKEVDRSCFLAKVSDINSNKGISDIDISCGGKFRRDTGVIESVQIYEPGRYFIYNGTPLQTKIFNRDSRRYYREDKNVPPYIANLKIGACGDGSGAQISATIAADPINDVENFGKITSLNIDDGGENYLAWRWIPSCNEKINNLPFVLRAQNPQPLVSACVKSCFGEGAKVELEPRDRVASDSFCQCSQPDPDYLNVYDPGKYISNISPSSTVEMVFDYDEEPASGRVEPIVSISKKDDSTGDGGTFTPTLTKMYDSCGTPYWTISSVQVEGGQCYGADRRTEPILFLNGIINGSPLKATLEEFEGVCGGGKSWRIAHISVVNSLWTWTTGSIPIIITPFYGASKEVSPAQATLIIPDINNINTAYVEIIDGGEYYGYPNPSQEGLKVDTEDDVIVHAELMLNFDENGVPINVNIDGNGGAFYKQDASVEWQGNCHRYWDYDGSPSSIRGVRLIHAGSGYARLGRENPQISSIEPTNIQASGLEFKHTLVQKEDKCHLPYWTIESVEVSGDTTCYTSKNRQKPINLKAKTKRGVGAKFTIALEELADNCQAKYWTIDSIQVSGGCNYFNGDKLTIITPKNVFVEKSADITIQATDMCEPISVNIIDGGKYYIPGFIKEPLRVILKDGESEKNPRDIEEKAADLILHNSCNGSGLSVSVLDGGVYFRENKNLPPYVADVSIEIDQGTGSNGHGAEFEVEVFQDTSNLDTYYDGSYMEFGKIKSIKFKKGNDGKRMVGQDYVFYGGSQNCKYTGGCNDSSCYGHGGITLQFPEKDKPQLKLELGDGSTQLAIFEYTNEFYNCDNTEIIDTIILYGTNGGNVNIHPGGDWQTGGTLCCGDKCKQYYIRGNENDPYEGEMCGGSNQLDSVTLSCDTESKTVQKITLDPEGAGVGVGLGLGPTGVRVAGPWAYTCADGQHSEVSIMAYIKWLTRGLLEGGCGCKECVIDVAYGADLNYGDVYAIDNNPLDNFERRTSLSFDRCNDNTKSGSFKFFACEQQSSIEAWIEDPGFVRPGIRPISDMICPAGWIDDGDGGCYNEVIDFLFEDCEDDPGYGAYVEYCNAINGTLIPTIPGCVSCQYTIRNTSEKGCPEGFVSDGNGGCKGDGCYWDTWPQEYTDTEITITIDHNEPCYPPNCECAEPDPPMIL